VAGSTSKKIVVVRFDREPVDGFMNPQTGLQGSAVELLSAGGAVVTVPYTELKAVCFVRDFGIHTAWKAHRGFANRPKTGGLWLKLHFRDGDTLEGLVVNNLLVVDAQGFDITPPEAGLGTQRIFVPRAALTSVQVLGVVNSPLRAARKKVPREQLKMFDD
jgi:hypothetical protein